MKYTEMKKGLRYIVTSVIEDDGTFEIGDHLKVEDNGDVLNGEARGWIEEKYAPEAMKNIDVDLDCAFYESEISHYQRLINIARDVLLIHGYK
jgi:hypothetical protein